MSSDRLSMLMNQVSKSSPENPDLGDDNDDIIAGSCSLLPKMLSSSPISVVSDLPTVRQPQHSQRPGANPSTCTPISIGSNPPLFTVDEESTKTSSAQWPTFPMSSKALRTHNPIRAIVDPVLSSMNQCDSDKPRISLALGDPIAAVNGIASSCLQPCPMAIRSIMDALSNDPMKTASYANAVGTLEGRRAIAQYHSHPYYTYDPDADIVIANGCSGALELILSALLYQSNAETPVLLIPEPGFPLYRVIAESIGAMVMAYPLCPEQQWQVDLPKLNSIIQSIQKQNSSETRQLVIRGIVINNPSNPTGAVYQESHLKSIVQLCCIHHIPIIADEIYGDMIFDGMFVPLAEVAAEMGREVPVLTTSGIGKQFLLPGWRIGWICIQDNVFGSLQNVREGVKRLAQIILGASHLAQFAIPALLLKPSEESSSQSSDCLELMKWKFDVRNTLHEQSQAVCNALKQATPFLDVIEPQGAMYAMVRICLPYFDDKIRNDIDFMKLLLQEENVFVLPGTCFGFQDSFRIVFCAPIPVLTEAANRIGQFCRRHGRMKI